MVKIPPAERQSSSPGTNTTDLSFPAPLLKRCWFLAGPTASGKTAVGIELARRLNAEIVALDSMSLYRGMDIGTAKPDAEQRRLVPHHLLDIIEPQEEYSLAEYVHSARVVCEDIVSRARTPLFVGGTALYLRSILRGICEGPAADWSLRQRLHDEAERHGPEVLHQRLQQVDPVAAARLHVHDLRRVIRALEVFEQTGTPLSDQQQENARPLNERTPHVYWLASERDWLHARIALRVEQMFAAGLLEEVRCLASGPPLSRTAAQAVGYRELFDHLAGKLTYAEAKEQVIIHTRQFAKRQYTWFRNLEECVAVSMTGTESAVELAERIQGRFMSG